MAQEVVEGSVCGVRVMGDDWLMGLGLADEPQSYCVEDVWRSGRKLGVWARVYSWGMWWSCCFHTMAVAKTWRSLREEWNRCMFFSRHSITLKFVKCLSHVRSWIYDESNTCMLPRHLL